MALSDADFIEDHSRKVLKKAISVHLRHQRSLAIIGEHGEGKTTMLNRIEFATSLPIKRINSLGAVYEMLAEMAGESPARMNRKQEYAKMIEKSPRIIVMDEAQDAKEGIYVYLKRFMDSGSSVILAGRYRLLDILRDRHKDVLSRITPYPLIKIDFNQLATKHPDFEADAWYVLISKRQDSSRHIAKLVELCRYEASERRVEKITPEIVATVLKEIIDDVDG